MSDSTPGFSVLVVDGSPDAAERAADLLRLYGYQTSAAHSAQAALCRTASCRVDAVLFDAGTMGMDGCEFAERLLARAGRRPPFTIAVVEDSSEANRRRYADAGVSLCLAKPVEPGVVGGVFRRIRRFLDAAAPPDAQVGRAYANPDAQVHGEVPMAARPQEGVAADREVNVGT